MRVIVGPNRTIVCLAQDDVAVSSYVLRVSNLMVNLGNSWSQAFFRYITGPMDPMGYINPPQDQWFHLVRPY